MTTDPGRPRRPMKNYRKDRRCPRCLKVGLIRHVSALDLSACWACTSCGYRAETLKP